MGKKRKYIRPLRMHLLHIFLLLQVAFSFPKFNFNFFDSITNENHLSRAKRQETALSSNTDTVEGSADPEATDVSSNSLPIGNETVIETTNAPVLETEEMVPLQPNNITVTEKDSNTTETLIANTTTTVAAIVETTPLITTFTTSVMESTTTTVAETEAKTEEPSESTTNSTETTTQPQTTEEPKDETLVGKIKVSNS